MMILTLLSSSICESHFIFAIGLASDQINRFQRNKLSASSHPFSNGGGCWRKRSNWSNDSCFLPPLLYRVWRTGKCDRILKEGNSYIFAFFPVSHVIFKENLFLFGGRIDEELTEVISVYCRRWEKKRDRGGRMCFNHREKNVSILVPFHSCSHVIVGQPVYEVLTGLILVPAAGILFFGGWRRNINQSNIRSLRQYVLLARG